MNNLSSNYNAIFFSEILDQLYTERHLCFDIVMKKLLKNHVDTSFDTDEIISLLFSYCCDSINCEVVSKLNLDGSIEEFISSYFYLYVSWAMENPEQDFMLTNYVMNLTKKQIQQSLTVIFSELIEKVKRTWISSDFHFEDPIYLILSLLHTKNLVLDYIKLNPDTNYMTAIDLIYNKFWKGISPYKIKKVITTYR